MKAKAVNLIAAVRTLLRSKSTKPTSELETRMC